MYQVCPYTIKIIALGRIVRNCIIKHRPRSIGYLIDRSNQPKVFCRKDFFGNFKKLTGKHLCLSQVLNFAQFFLRILFLKNASGRCSCIEDQIFLCFAVAKKYWYWFAKPDLSVAGNNFVLIICTTPKT